MASSKVHRTVKISFDNRDRAKAVIRTLIRNHFFEGALPSEEELTRTFRLPKSSITLALEDLRREEIIKPSPTGSGFEFAGNLNLGSAGQVAFIVNLDIFRGWYAAFQDWLLGIDKSMSEEGYQIQIIQEFTSIEQKLERIKSLWEAGTAGFILASTAEKPIREFLADSRIPSVLLGNATLYQEDLGCICSDNRTGVHKAIDHLVELNHHNILLYATGVAYHDGFRERVLAYQQYMGLLGLPTHTSLIFAEPHNELIAAKAAAKLLEMKPLPTAVVCASDREAFELSAELKRLNVMVPDDVSIVGFANNHYGHVLEPAMTTIDIRAQDMGKVAANYLLNELESAQLPVKILIPTDLIQRASTTPIPSSPSIAAIQAHPHREIIEPGKPLAL